MKLKFLALATLTCLSSITLAQDVKGYIGLGAGFAGSNIEDTNSGESRYETSGASQFFGGVRLNQNVAIEAEFISIGNLKLTGGQVKTSGYGVSALIGAPVGNWSFFGKIGVTNLTSKLSADPGYVLLAPESQTKTGVVLGGGAEYAFTPQASVRLSLSSYDMAAGEGALTGRVNTYMASGVFKF